MICCCMFVCIGPGPPKVPVPWSQGPDPMGPRSRSHGPKVPVQWAHGRGPMGRVPWSHGPGPMVPWAWAHGPGPMVPSWAQAQGPSELVIKSPYTLLCGHIPIFDEIIHFLLNSCIFLKKCQKSGEKITKKICLTSRELV